MLFKWGTVSRINIKILSSQIYKIHSDHQESLNILLHENVIILKRSLFLFPKSKLWKMWALAEGLEKSKPWRLCVLLLPRTVPPCRECHPRGQMAWYMFMAWTSSHQVKKKKKKSNWKCPWYFYPQKSKAEPPLLMAFSIRRIMSPIFQKWQWWSCKRLTVPSDSQVNKGRSLYEKG